MNAALRPKASRTRLQATLRSLRARRRRRGMALILVLGALAILTVMLTETQDESSADFSAALATRDQLAAEYAAKSAINLSRLLIAAEPTIRNSLPILAMAFGGTVPQLPVWNYAEQALGAFNDAQGKESFATLSGLDMNQGEHLGLEGAGFEVTIVDEDSKINVNLGARSAFSKQRLMQQLIALMQPPQYDAIFSSEDADGQFSDRQAICSAIIDWSDSDQDLWPCDGSDTAQASAPEDAYYERLDKPYTRKNAPFDSLYELYRVRGMSEDFWATFVEPDPDKPDDRVMTIWGQDKINVNTANSLVILTLICQTAELPAKICEGGEETLKFLSLMGMMKAMTQGAPLFGSPKVFVETLEGKGMLGPILADPALGITLPKIKSPQDLLNQLGTESKVFSIYARGFVRAGKRETLTKIQAVVDFRDAPPPGQAPGTPGTQGAGGTSGSSPPPTTPPVNSQGSGINDALKPNSGGNIVYYRLD